MNNILIAVVRVFSVLGLLMIILLLCRLYKNYNKRRETYDNIIDNVKLNNFDNHDLFKSMIHNSNPRKEYLTSNMVVPTYSQDTYIPSENNRVIFKDNKKLSREDKKVNSMNVLNLCYNDSNDDLNISLVAKNLHVSP